MTLALCVGNAAYAERLWQRALSLVTFFGQTKKVAKKRKMRRFEDLVMWDMQICKCADGLFVMLNLFQHLFLHLIVLANEESNSKRKMPVCIGMTVKGFAIAVRCIIERK